MIHCSLYHLHGLLKAREPPRSVPGALWEVARAAPTTRGADDAAGTVTAGGGADTSLKLARKRCQQRGLRPGILSFRTSERVSSLQRQACCPKPHPRAHPPSAPSRPSLQTSRTPGAQLQKSQLGLTETTHPMLLPEQIVRLSIKHFHSRVLDNFRDRLKRNMLQEPCQPQKGLVTQKDQV